jgi:hypothetical protein
MLTILPNPSPDPDRCSQIHRCLAVPVPTFRLRDSLSVALHNRSLRVLVMGDEVRLEENFFQWTTSFTGRSLGVTRIRGFLHPDQNVLNATQNSLCKAVNRRRGCCACRASNCRRRARFSRTRSSRQLKALTNQPRKCRSDTIMARIVAEKPESSFAPSHSFCRCTTFWRSTARIHTPLTDASHALFRETKVYS